VIFILMIALHPGDRGAFQRSLFDLPPMWSRDSSIDNRCCRIWPAKLISPMAFSGSGFAVCCCKSWDLDAHLLGFGSPVCRTFCTTRTEQAMADAEHLRPGGLIMDPIEIGLGSSAGLAAAYGGARYACGVLPQPDGKADWPLIWIFLG